MASAFDAVIDGFDIQMKTEGITRSNHLNMSNLAKQVGLKDEFDAVNQVCSKFVHPTSWSIFTAELGTDRFRDARDIFYTCGAQYFSMAFAEIAPHIRKWGLRHKP